MFIVNIRYRALPASSTDNTISKYRHVQLCEPALNNRQRMSASEVTEFNRMQREGLTESIDINAMLQTTYKITED